MAARPKVAVDLQRGRKESTLAGWVEKVKNHAEEALVRKGRIKTGSQFRPIETNGQQVRSDADVTRGMAQGMGEGKLDVLEVNGNEDILHVAVQDLTEHIKQYQQELGSKMHLTSTIMRAVICETMAEEGGRVRAQVRQRVTSGHRVGVKEKCAEVTGLLDKLLIGELGETEPGKVFRWRLVSALEALERETEAEWPEEVGRDQGGPNTRNNQA